MKTTNSYIKLRSLSLLGIGTPLKRKLFWLSSTAVQKLCFFFQIATQVHVQLATNRIHAA